MIKSWPRGAKRGSRGDEGQGGRGGGPGARAELWGEASSSGGRRAEGIERTSSRSRGPWDRPPVRGGASWDGDQAEGKGKAGPAWNSPLELGRDRADWQGAPSPAGREGGPEEVRWERVQIIFQLSKMYLKFPSQGLSSPSVARCCRETARASFEMEYRVGLYSCKGRGQYS